jgi:predicted nucleotidyltransferase component of viral defense system
MLSKNELIELTKTTRRKLHQQEKDYVQMIALYHIYQQVASELVFKGGTALEKVYGLNRFSEDLDFTRNDELDLEALVEKVLIGIRNYGIDCDVKKERSRFEFSDKYKLSAKGPLYSGDVSKVFIRIEISGREKTIMNPSIMNIFPKYRDIPNFSLAAMPIEEIAAEKVRAILTRDKPRDVYDLWFLLNNNAKVNYDMINKKLEYYDLAYSYSVFKDKIDGCAAAWENELSNLLPSVPSFKEIEGLILGEFKNIKK